MDSLQYPYAFAESEELTEFFGSNLDFDWDLVERAHCCDLCIIYLQDSSFARLKLAFNHFTSIATLNL